MPDGRGWPRRACIRTQRYRLDLSSRIDGAYTTAEDEDLFFVDTEICPEENRNMAALPEYAGVIQVLRQKLRAHLDGCVEADSGSIHIHAGGIPLV